MNREAVERGEVQVGAGGRSGSLGQPTKPDFTRRSWNALLVPGGWGERASGAGRARLTDQGTKGRGRIGEPEHPEAWGGWGPRDRGLPRGENMGCVRG